MPIVTGPTAEVEAFAAAFRQGQPKTPTAVALIDGFLKDLQDIGQLFKGEGTIATAREPVDRVIYFNVPTGQTRNFKLDADYFFKAIIPCGQTGSWVLSTDGSQAGTVQGATALTILDSVLATGNVTYSTISGIVRIPLLKDSKIYYHNGAASNHFVTIYLQKA